MKIVNKATRAGLRVYISCLKIKEDYLKEIQRVWKNSKMQPVRKKKSDISTPKEVRLQNGHQVCIKYARVNIA